MAEFCGVHSLDFMAGDRLVFLEEVVSVLSPGREEMRGHCLEGTAGGDCWKAGKGRGGTWLQPHPGRQCVCVRK